ncbi:MAG TPA: sigma-54 dependent transcriptional regulator [Kofleriaceae bacterium]|nr:sigma-54 dependent transcriptional regulator [Kofleriaceae bacterium]
MSVADEAEVPLRILLVDDEPDIADPLAFILREQGHRVMVSGDGNTAMRRLGEHTFDLLVCDVRLPGTDGLSIFRYAKHARPEMAVILMSAYGSIAEAVEALKHDAAHYLGKPFPAAELLEAVHDVQVGVAARNASRADLADHVGGPEAVIVGISPQMISLRAFLRTIAASEGPVLITGETGTGKELVAQTIRVLGSRRGEAFMAVNCAAFPDTLLEAELFGHARGAFTGAARAREGKFRAAHGGTLFLDEIGEMAMGAQAKLLRALETGSFQPLGSDRDVTVDVRIISATNRELNQLGQPQFRHDLFYRLKMFHVHVPPLRERPVDIPGLVHRFLCEARPGAVPRVCARAWSALAHYDYPGNIRELKNIVGHALALAADSPIDVAHLPPELRAYQGCELLENGPGVMPLAEAGREFERDYLRRTLEATEGNKTRAAAALGISRKTLWKKLRDLDVEA